MVGSKLCIAKLVGFQKQFTEGSKFAVKQWGDNVMNISREHYVPVDTGALCSTGIVTVMADAPNNYTIQLSYGGQGSTSEMLSKTTRQFFKSSEGRNVHYAAIVHEIPARHKHGTWKYLTTPFNEQSNKLENMIEDRNKGLI